MAVHNDSDFFAPRETPLLSILAYRVAEWVDGAGSALHFYIVASQTERALSRLSDRQLEDVGLRREDIRAFSRRKAQG